MKPKMGSTLMAQTGKIEKFELTDYCGIYKTRIGEVAKSVNMIAWNNQRSVNYGGLFIMGGPFCCVSFQGFPIFIIVHHGVDQSPFLQEDGPYD
jgi:hypothetical protein